VSHKAKGKLSALELAKKRKRERAGGIIATLLAEADPTAAKAVSFPRSIPAITFACHLDARARHAYTRNVLTTRMHMMPHRAATLLPTAFLIADS